MRSWSSENDSIEMKTVRCFHSHPPLVLNDGLKIYGGSCSMPVVLDAEVYVGFDYSMKKSPLSYPWTEGESFLYPIQDMGVPTDWPSFEKLIEWLAVQLTAKRKVHLGCIGGHGRTGLVLAALVKTMMDENDAIAYVRKNYCVKAVESLNQVEFLVSRYGVNKAQPAKAIHGTASVMPHSHGIARKEPERKGIGSSGGIVRIPEPETKRVSMASVGSSNKEVRLSGKVQSIWGVNSPFGGRG